MIMPLASQRDKDTQVAWGVADFVERFERDPEGMWLPETAVDLATLETLVRYGIKFTILSPYQAAKFRKIGEEDWQSAEGGKIDPKRPYLCRLPSGKEITLFFYDGPISQELGFGNLLENGENFANRLVGTFAENRDEAQMVHIATDGETYGHHRRNGDMALAYCLYHIVNNKQAEITVYGEFLEKHPPAYEAQIFENTSWSCAHGIERWRSNCGCNSGMHQGWTQEWRKPLREAMDWLRDRLSGVYEKQASSLLQNPWEARNKYIDVILDRSMKNVEKFLSRESGRELSGEEKVKALKLLEMQRHAMLIFTSCGWFFDEISGIETTQVMQYAARAMQLAREVGDRNFEDEFIEKLQAAPSNIREFENGAQVYEKYIQPATLDLLRVGSHYAVSSLFEEYPSSTQIYCYRAENKNYDKVNAGRLEMAVGRAHIRSDITWNESEISFVVLYLGGHILNGGVREFMGEEAFSEMYRDTKAAFLKSDIPEVIRLMDDHFETHNYSLWHLFKDQQRKVFDQILASSLEEIELHFRQIYQNDYTLLRAMQEMQIPIPKAIMTPVEYVLNTDLRNVLENDSADVEQLRNLIAEFKRLNISLEKKRLNLAAGQHILRLMRQLSENEEDGELVRHIVDTLHFLESIDLDLDIWEAQNIYFIIGKNKFDELKSREESGDEAAGTWLKAFESLGEAMRVKLQ